MAVAYCPICGTAVIPHSTVCSSCGASLTEWGSLAGGSAAPVSPWHDPWRLPGYPATAGPSPESEAADRRALSDLNAAALFAVLAFVISVFAIGVTPALSVLSSIAVHVQTSANFPGLSAIVLLFAALVVGVAFSVIQLALYRRAFRNLAPFDLGFRTPGTLAMLALVGVVTLAVVAIALVLAVLQQQNGCPSPDSCPLVGDVLLLLGLLLIVAVLVIVGYIGVAVGVWRVGTHFGVELFKPAAILMLVFGIVGAILILVAVHSARRSLGPVTRTIPVT